MRALDKRLLRRARAVRRLLVVDVLLGLGAAILVLVQATLLASIVTRAFYGAALPAVLAALALLMLTFAGRGAFAWAFEVAGRRAASGVPTGRPLRPRTILGQRDAHSTLSL